MQNTDQSIVNPENAGTEGALNSILTDAKNVEKRDRVVIGNDELDAVSGGNYIYNPHRNNKPFVCRECGRSSFRSEQCCGKSMLFVGAGSGY